MKPKQIPNVTKNGYKEKRLKIGEVKAPCPYCGKGIKIMDIFKVINCPHCEKPYDIALRLVKSDVYEELWRIAKGGKK